MKVKLNGIDITNYVCSVTWSGSARQAARMLTITVISAPYDKNIPTVTACPGDWVKLIDDDGNILIDAMIYNRSRTSENGTISYDGYDELNRLLKSNGTYNFKNTTPEIITKKVCNDISIKVKNIAKTGINIKSMIVDGESFYDIIIKAYMRANYVNGKKYMLLAIGRKIAVIERGKVIENYKLEEDSNIIKSEYSESIESMINRIKIYDDKGRQIGEVKKDKDIEKYGVFQDVYTKEDGVNPVMAAKKLLIGTEKEASVEAIGNVQCISGYAIKIKDSASGLTGKFWIENDSHTWENGIHKMSLTLAFKNIMKDSE